MVGKSFIAALVCAVALVGAAPLDRSAELVPVPVRPVNLAASAVAHRIVAVGDIHSDVKAAVSVLKMAGLIDSQENWIGGTNTFISTVSCKKKLLMSALFTLKENHYSNDDTFFSCSPI